MDLFDTTATNTGRHSGVNTRLNQYLNKEVLHLACRHHVFECHIKNISKLFRITSGPENILFKTLADSFDAIKFTKSDLKRFIYGQNDQLDLTAKASLDAINRILVQGNLPRGDYYELAQFVRFYLSETGYDDFNLKQPGAFHHARFLSQAIYYLKLEILSNVTNIASTAPLKKEVKEMSEFIALFYARWFLMSSHSVVSPRMDLEAMWEMKAYSAIRPNVAKKCLASMQNHTWYLHPSLIPFSLADSEISESEKSDIAQKLWEVINGDIPEPQLNYTKVEIRQVIEQEHRPNLATFITTQSTIIFKILKIEKESLEWLRLPPNLWHLISGFRKFEEFVKNVPVVNDAAERNVKLIQDYVGSSRDENLRQDLLLAVEFTRKTGRPRGTRKRKLE